MSFAASGSDGSAEMPRLVSRRGPGANLIVVAARDTFGNDVEGRITVIYEASGGVSLPWAAGVVAAGALAGVLIAFLLVRRGVRIPGLSRGREPEEGPSPEAEAVEPAVEEPGPEEPLEEAVPEEAVPEEAPGGPAEEVEEAVPEQVAEEDVGETPAAGVPAAEAPRVTRLRAALAEGRISQEVFEQNLQRITPAAPLAPAPALAVDPRIARLRKAYEEGRITKEVYQENLRRIRDERRSG